MFTDDFVCMPIINKYYQMDANYRLYNENDIDDLVTFWNEHGGWDIIDRSVWEHRFYHTPHGPTAIVLALDSTQNSILGQMIFIPNLISVQGLEINALRPYAIIVNKNFRCKVGYLALFEQIIKMYKYSISILSEQGVQLIYMLPDPRWARAFKLYSNLAFEKVLLENFPLWSLKLTENYFEDLPKEYTVEDIPATDHRIDMLWEQARNFYGNSLVRNSKTLTWKLSHKKYKTIGVLKNNILIGFSASFYRREDKQWLICDMIVKDQEALCITVRAHYQQALMFKKTLPEDEHDRLEKLAILATPAIQQITKEMGFKKDNYNFPMIVHIIDSKLNANTVKPELWYVGAHD